VGKVRANNPVELLNLEQRAVEFASLFLERWCVCRALWVWRYQLEAMGDQRKLATDELVL
jgi:hypothetical protein